ncbi:hypothetical protein GE09DRAFT_1223394 [Coniochaeta sp. 2T2.1]|nr:hypothetical protein GE09DRAFT_1223394 [Coniochaeta sp. 2T2.1]
MATRPPLQYLCLWAKLTLWLGYNALAFRSALLSASLDDRRAEATDWVVYALLTGYFLITLFTGWVAYYLHNRTTGFRKGWETLNIADHLALFRHSNFLDAFEGSGIATRESMIAELGTAPRTTPVHSRADLLNGGMASKRWTKTTISSCRPGSLRFFPLAMTKTVKASPPNTISILKTISDTGHILTVRELSNLRYNSVFGIMRSSAALRYSIIAFVCLVGYVLALSLVKPDTKVFTIGVSPNITAFILGYVVTYVFSLFSFFWEEMYLFAAITEPFVGMDKPEGADADQALLLNYTGSPRFIAMFDAASRGHWKVFRTGVYATLQRSLPIIVGASIKIFPISPDRSEVQFSTPLSIVVIVFMVVYLVIIPYEVFEAGYSRHLPRDCLVIADLLSWTCCSSILRNNTITLNDDQLEEKLPPTNPLDTRSDPPHNEKWHMEARLRLAQQRFSMGLIRVSSRNGMYMVGIDTSTAARLYRPTKGLRRRIAGTRKEGNRAENPETTYKVAGVGKGSAFTVINASEKSHAASFQYEGTADLLRSVMPRDLGEVV